MTETMDNLTHLEQIMAPTTGSALSLNGCCFQFLGLSLETLRPQAAEPTHEHVFFEALYLVSGSGQVVTPKQNQRVRTGQVAIIAPGQKHALSPSEESQGLYFRWLMKPESSFQSDFCETLQPPDRLMQRLRLSPVQVCADERSLLIRSLLQGLADLKGQSLLTLQIRFLQVILGLEALCERDAAQLQEETAGKRRAPEDLVESLIHYIDSHHVLPLTSDQMAAAVGLSYGHVSRVFRQVTGMTLNEYLSMTRLKHAQRELRDTRDSVKNIARRCGFAKVNYFSSLFKRRYGLSPLSYRRAHQKENESSGYQ